MAQDNIPPLKRPPRTTNTFNKGMHQDRDPQYLAQDTYFESVNGRIIKNRNGTYAWENMEGVKLLFSLSPGYFLLGAGEFSDKCVLFSSNDVNSEIGIMIVDAEGKTATYQQIYNDLYDPNGDFLNFRFDRKIDSVCVRENTASIERDYFNDRFNFPRIININIGKQSESPQFTNGDYLPVGSPAKYPWFYSAHSMARQPDFKAGYLKFVSQFVPASGTGIKTGVFQYCYQLETRDGYRTPWSLLTRHFFVTLDPATLGSHHDRSMYASNVNSGKGMNLKIEGVDDRYYRIRVAYVYSIDKDATVEFTMFHQQDIVPGTTTYTLQHESHSGEPVSFDELTTTHVSINRVETEKEKDLRLWLMGVDINTGFKIDVDAITIEPFMRDMTADKYIEASIGVPLYGGRQETPFTDTNKTGSDTIDIQAYLDNTGTPVNNSFDLIDDYSNYHGMQWEHLFPGYWRGETYPFSIVVFDRRGIAWFAQPIKDFTFPEQYQDNDFYDLMDDPGVLKMMGIKVSGIDLTEILWDNYGNLRISGFAIMRTERVPRILMQGVVFPTVYSKHDSGSEIDITRPMPTLSNIFGVPYYTPGGLTHDTDVERSNALNDYGLRPETALMHSPELMFEYPIWTGTNQSGVVENVDVIKMVSKSYGAYTNNTIPAKSGGDAWTDFIELEGANYHFYSKQYNVGGIAEGGVTLGSESRISLMYTTQLATDKEGYDVDNLDLDWHYTAYWYYSDICSNEKRASTAEKAWLLKTKDFEDVHLAKLAHNCGMYTANYIVRRSSYYTPDDETSLEKRLYIPTGHFQPVTKEILDTVKNDEGRYIFNGVEVWGGDCYVNLWDFTRIVPQFSEDCDDTPCYKDHGHSVIVPIESNLNIALRKGRTFASKGTKPEAEACDNATSFFDKGIWLGQPEESFLNSVLLHQENICFFPSIPSNIDVEQDAFPTRVYYSEQKFYGEIVDNYRKVLPNSFGDITGVYGKITGSAVLFDQIYVYQKSAYGRLRINERAVITTVQGEETNVGTGKTLADQPIEYVFGKTQPNASFGCQHPFSIVTTKRGIYWIDVDKKTVCRHAQDGFTSLSDDYELHDWSEQYLPHYENELLSRPPNGQYRHIHGAYDASHDEIIWTLMSSFRNDRQFTLIFCEDDRFNAFETFVTQYPFLYFAHKALLFAGNPDYTKFQDVYVAYNGNRGYFFDGFKQSTLRLTVNVNAKAYKKFDTLVMNINEGALELLQEIRFTTEENTYSVFPQTDNRVIYRYGELLVPVFALGQDRRMEGKYMTVDFIFNNADDKRIIFTSLDTKFRFSKPN